MERERERVRKVTEGVTGLGMNEDTGRAEEMVAVCTKKERRKEKVETLSMGATARTEKIEGGVRRGCRRQ